MFLVSPIQIQRILEMVLCLQPLSVRGVAPYSYKWTGGVSGVGKEFTTSFSTAGTKTANVEVKDNLGKTATNSCSVEVVYNPNEGLCDTVENQCIVGNFVDVADSNTQYLWNCVGR